MLRFGNKSKSGNDNDKSTKRGVRFDDKDREVKVYVKWAGTFVRLPDGAIVYQGGSSRMVTLYRLCSLDQVRELLSVAVGFSVDSSSFALKFQLPKDDSGELLELETANDWDTMWGEVEDLQRAAPDIVLRPKIYLVGNGEGGLERNSAGAPSAHTMQYMLRMVPGQSNSSQAFSAMHMDSGITPMPLEIRGPGGFVGTQPAGPVLLAGGSPSPLGLKSMASGASNYTSDTADIVSPITPVRTGRGQEPSVGLSYAGSAAFPGSPPESARDADGSMSARGQQQNLTRQLNAGPLNGRASSNQLSNLSQMSQMSNESFSPRRSDGTPESRRSLASQPSPSGARVSLGTRIIKSIFRGGSKRADKHSVSQADMASDLVKTKSSPAIRKKEGALPKSGSVKHLASIHMGHDDPEPRASEPGIRGGAYLNMNKRETVPVPGGTRRSHDIIHGLVPAAPATRSINVPVAAGGANGVGPGVPSGPSSVGMSMSTPPRTGILSWGSRKALKESPAGSSTPPPASGPSSPLTRKETPGRKQLQELADLDLEVVGGDGVSDRQTTGSPTTAGRSLAFTGRSGTPGMYGRVSDRATPRVSDRATPRLSDRATPRVSDRAMRVSDRAEKEPAEGREASNRGLRTINNWALGGPGIPAPFPRPGDLAVSSAPLESLIEKEGEEREKEKEKDGRSKKDKDKKAAAEVALSGGSAGDTMIQQPLLSFVAAMQRGLHMKRRFSYSKPKRYPYMLVVGGDEVRPTRASGSITFGHYQANQRRSQVYESQQFTFRPGQGENAGGPSLIRKARISDPGASVEALKMMNRPVSAPHTWMNSMLTPDMRVRSDPYLPPHLTISALDPAGGPLVDRANSTIGIQYSGLRQHPQGHNSNHSNSSSQHNSTAGPTRGNQGAPHGSGGVSVSLGVTPRVHSNVSPSKFRVPVLATLAEGTNSQNNSAPSSARDGPSRDGRHSIASPKTPSMRFAIDERQAVVRKAASRRGSSSAMAVAAAVEAAQAENGVRTEAGGGSPASSAAAGAGEPGASPPQASAAPGAPPPPRVSSSAGVDDEVMQEEARDKPGPLLEREDTMTDMAVTAVEGLASFGSVESDPNSPASVQGGFRPPVRRGSSAGTAFRPMPGVIRTFSGGNGGPESIRSPINSSPGHSNPGSGSPAAQQLRGMSFVDRRFGAGGAAGGAGGPLDFRRMTAAHRASLLRQGSSAREGARGTFARDNLGLDGGAAQGGEAFVFPGQPRPAFTDDAMGRGVSAPDRTTATPLEDDRVDSQSGSRVHRMPSLVSMGPGSNSAPRRQSRASVGMNWPPMAQNSFVLRPSGGPDSTVELGTRSSVLSGDPFRRGMQHSPDADMMGDRSQLNRGGLGGLGGGGGGFGDGPGGFLGLQLHVGSTVGYGNWTAAGDWQAEQNIIDWQSQLPHQIQQIPSEDITKVKELGRGQFGSVWLARWRGVEIAIKEMHGGDQRAREEMIQEAQVLNSLRHPAVVSFYGIQVNGENPATVLEYVAGGNLRKALVGLRKLASSNKQLADALSTRFKARLALNAARGMEYLHSQSVVHFDLKADNLLVDLRDMSRPVVKIGDMGLSKVKLSTFVSGNFRGTLPWMAPELFPRASGPSSAASDAGGGSGAHRGEDSSPAEGVTEKVDIFSFGVVMWEVLSMGGQPYEKLGTADIFSGIMNGTLRPEMPPDCPPNWAKLMTECWDHKPSKRPSFSEIAARLEEIIKDGGGAPTHPTPGSHASGSHHSSAAAHERTHGHGRGGSHSSSQRAPSMEGKGGTPPPPTRATEGFRLPTPRPSMNG